jgi:hypothetical protein
MNLKMTYELLNKFGVEVYLENTVLHKKAIPGFDYAMLKYENRKWLNGVFLQERQNDPHFETVKEFNSESEAAKSFFIYELGSKIRMYFLSPEYRKNNIIDIYRENFVYEDFFKLMDSREINKNLLITKESQALGRAIMLVEEYPKQYRLCFVSKDKTLHKFAVLLDSREALFWVYKMVFTLDFFEKEVEPVLKEEGIYKEFSEEDVYSFIG